MHISLSDIDPQNAFETKVIIELGKHQSEILTYYGVYIKTTLIFEADDILGIAQTTPSSH